jgi:glycine hydroxymethyltransferase
MPTSASFRSSANLAVIFAAGPGDSVLYGQSNGGHRITEACQYVGKDFSVLPPYKVYSETESIDFGPGKCWLSKQPKLIVAGEALSKNIEADKFREIADEVGALLLVIGAFCRSGRRA